MSGAGSPSDTKGATPREEMSSCEDLAAIFRALGHPARLAIVRQLARQNDACCGEIVSHLPLAQSTVSQHLQVLKEAGLLSCDTRGRNCHYLLNREKLRQAEQSSNDFWSRLNSFETSGLQSDEPSVPTTK
ncbi:metalloregulator ArsR/SmtB family transcription factor [Labrenzia sp. OB1]|uniref:ArsR/SmtB family transcription factor n=1 Tax=Labrenzia sp. OB1 TaxID=1561204 RepID=UPI000837E268|nr:metalloregulator ArsR/SmtB family transcription factor [Labrenzia sp. OB1]